MNICMAGITITFICTLAIAFLDPAFMRWLCSRGLTWAACYENFRKNLKHDKKLWEEHCGL